MPPAKPMSLLASSHPHDAIYHSSDWRGIPLLLFTVVILLSRYIALYQLLHGSNTLSISYSYSIIIYDKTLSPASY